MEKRLIDANALKDQAVEMELPFPPYSHRSAEKIVFVHDINDAPTIDAVPREEYKRLELELAAMKAFMRYIAVELPNPCRYCKHNEVGKVCEQECYGQGMEHFAFEWRGLPDTIFGKMEEA